MLGVSLDAGLVSSLVVLSVLLFVVATFILAVYFGIGWIGRRGVNARLAALEKRSRRSGQAKTPRLHLIASNLTKGMIHELRHRQMAAFHRGNSGRYPGIHQDQRLLRCPSMARPSRCNARRMMNRRLGDLTCGQTVGIIVAVLPVAGVAFGVVMCAIEYERQAQQCQTYGLSQDECRRVFGSTQKGPRLTALP